MINPALFIGLGSTGLRILSRFQELIVEHYGVASLPIFKYVCLETEKNNKIDIPPWASNAIDLIYPTVPATDIISRELDGEKKYLKDWLSPKLLKIPEGSFEHGASNIRMAGRLCLWENWDKVTSVLKKAQGIIAAEPNRNVTEAFLKDWYKKIKKHIDPNQVLLENLPNIYIVGTLCGGTCSGMFVDLGYYVKSLFNLWSKGMLDKKMAKVIGVFTISDSGTLKKATDELPIRQAANCWAGLLEYDYWCHPDSEYEVAFPDGASIENTNESPLDWVYLLSCSGNNINLHDEDGNPDINALEHLAAMVLFSETVGDLLAWKEGRRTDFRSSPRSLKPNKNEHMACLASCGMAAVWYPKYRIAESSACKYAVDDILKKWKGLKPSSDTQTVIERDARKIWKDIMEAKRGLLTSGPNGSLRSRISQAFASNREQLLLLPSGNLLDQLQSQLKTLTEEGVYDKHIRATDRQETFQEQLVEALEDEIKEKINTGKSIAYCQYLLEKLDCEIEKEIKNIPKEYPDPDLTVPGKDLLVDAWSKFVVKGKEVLEMMKKEFIDEYEWKMKTHVDTIRDFRVKPSLEEIRAYLGAKKQLPKEKEIAGHLSVKQKLDELESRVDRCIEDFEKKAKERAERIRETQGIRIITEKLTADEDESIVAEDIKKLYSNMKENLTPTEKESILRKAMSQASLQEFLGYDTRDLPPERILAAIHTATFQKALDLIGDFNIIAEWNNRYDAQQKRNFASTAEPLLELSGKLASKQLGEDKMPEVIIGKDDINLTKLGILQTVLDQDGAANKVRFSHMMSDPELDYLLIFNKEEGLIYMDENLASSNLFEQKYEKETEEGNIYGGLHTHKSGRNFFNVWVAKRRREAQENLMPIARGIFSRRDMDGKWRSSEIFEIEEETLILRFKRKDGKDVTLMGDLDKGIETLAQDGETFEYFKNRTCKKVREVEKAGYMDRLNEYLEWVEKKARKDGRTLEEALGEREKEDKKHDEILSYAMAILEKRETEQII